MISPPRVGSPSKRWETTLSSAQQDVARNMKSFDRKAMVKDLHDRKISNTRTSIKFGNDPVSYISDARENQTKIQGVQVDRAADVAAIRKMKADLTVTNFRLGDEEPFFETTSGSAMATTNESFSASLKANRSQNNAKEMIKKSSLHFGNEPVDYQSVSHQAMEYRGTAANFAALKEEVGKMSTTLRKHNFSFGEEKVTYQSDYNRGYGSVPLDAYRAGVDKKQQLKTLATESRRCHFTLGHDPVQYQSNTQSALRDVLSRDTGDGAQSVERAKEMKAALQKTSFIIGDDDAYM